MKTRHYILLSATMIAAVLAGCQKKSAESQASETCVKKTFYASTTGGEKTTLATDFNTLWTEGDKIKVFANGGAGADFTLTTGAGTSYGEFSGSTAATGPYVAVYPSTFATSASGTTATIALPATQSITVAGTFATNTVPLVAYSENDFLYFKNIGSLLCLSLKTKSGNSTLTKIELLDNDGANLAGTFTVKADDSQPKAVFASDGSTTLTVNCSNITLNSTTSTNLYIFVPAGVFANGFTATLYREADNKMAEVITTSKLTTESSKGQIFAADVEFKPYCKKCTYTQTITDICGITYNLVNIGSQIWMAENMRCDKYGNNSERAGATLSTSSSYTYNPYYTPTRSGDPAAYGYYYNWAAAMGYKNETEATAQTGAYSGTRQGICPDGFHIPSRSELLELDAAIDDEQDGKRLKSCDGWNNNGNGDNETCFAALPVGYAGGSTLSGVGASTSYWLSDAKSDKFAYFRTLTSSSDVFSTSNFNKYRAFSVRCLKD